MIPWSHSIISFIIALANFLNLYIKNVLFMLSFFSTPSIHPGSPDNLSSLHSFLHTSLFYSFLIQTNHHRRRSLVSSLSLNIRSCPCLQVSHYINGNDNIHEMTTTPLHCHTGWSVATDRHRPRRQQPAAPTPYVIS